jgi:O-antigen/teichoic acid export membrane protein
MKRKGGFLAKATGTFLTMGFSTCLGFIVNLILARVLGPAGKGVIAPALSAATIGITIASLGIDHSVAYFLDKKSFRAKDVLLTSFLFAIISGALASLGILLALEYVIPEASSLTRLFFAGGVFFTVIYNISHSGLLGRNRLGLINLGRVASDVLRTILATLFLYSLWPSVEGFAFAYMIAQALNAILVTVFAFREVGIIGASKPLPTSCFFYPRRSPLPFTERWWERGTKRSLLQGS